MMIPSEFAHFEDCIPCCWMMTTCPTNRNFSGPLISIDFLQFRLYEWMNHQPYQITMATMVDSFL